MATSLAALFAALFVYLASANVKATFCLTDTSRDLPVVFMHGLLANTSAGTEIGNALAAEGRAFISLDFCTDECSSRALQEQVSLGVKALQDIQMSDDRLSNGYILIGHSQGGIIIRSIAEEMDDHCIRKLITLASPHNGLFYGPQKPDLGLVKLFLKSPDLFFIQGKDTFPFDQYTVDDIHGKLQLDFHDWATRFAGVYSPADLNRFPKDVEWIASSDFYPKYNNMNDCGEEATADYDSCRQEQQRRRNNFLKVNEVHFLSSPDDGVLTPWQSGIGGRYGDFTGNMDDFIPAFDLLEPILMNQTTEFISDTYGLRTMSDHGSLFLTSAPKVEHVCWLADGVSCTFRATYDEYIYPLLH